jgi:hypothetical protein
MYSLRILMRQGQFMLAQQTLLATKRLLAEPLAKSFFVMAAQVARFF